MAFVSWLKGVRRGILHIQGGRRRRRLRPVDVVERLEDRTLLSSVAGCRATAFDDSFVDESGAVLAVDPAPNPWLLLPAEEAIAEAPPYALSQTFQLHSNPGASKVIYLDFDGHTTTGTLWNNSYGETIVTPAYSLDGESSFSAVELEQVQKIWQRVAEDFIPFDVDVTTEDPGLEALRNTGGGDTEWGIRVVIGENTWFDPAGGVAYIGAFDWRTDTPCFVFNTSVIGVAEAVTHEVGHTLGLRHDGSSTAEYFEGYGSGPTSWAPIMGMGYYRSLVQWSQGEYPDADNTEDDLSIITTGYGFGYRADDHGGTIGTASPLYITGGTNVFGEGIIERNTDLDYFVFTTGTGTISLDIDPFSNSPNLDVLATLYDSAGTTLAVSNPTNSLDAAFDLSLVQGTYYVSIEGTGKPAGADPGYSDYGSLGYYSISGSIVDFGNHTDIDFGDAPEAPYATTALNNGAAHVLVPDGPYLGSLVDPDPDGQPTARADGDDALDGSDDEDGLGNPARDLSLTAGTTPAVDVIVTNNSGRAATLVGWIDYDGDGFFSNDTERATVLVPDGTNASVVTLTFPVVPEIFAADTFARFRISTDSTAENPTGLADDGEVEDYAVTIVSGRVPVVPLAEFDVDAEGFSYADNLFHDTRRPKYADGTWIPNGGLDGGALQVTLGGVDTETVRRMSGGWQRTFQLDAPTQVTVSFDYNLTQGRGYEPDEWSQVLLRIDETLLGDGANDYVAQITGDGAGGSRLTTGWQHFEIDVGELAAGEHTLVIGGYNNKKTYIYESTEILFDNVSVVATDRNNRPNNPPTDIVLSSTRIDENVDTSAGAAVGTLSTVDADYGEKFTYSVVGGADAAVFSIGGAASDELILTDGVLDFESKSSYEATIRTTDSGGRSYDETFLVTVNDLNEPPSNLSLTGGRVPENAARGTSAGIVTVTDPDAGELFRYQLIDNADGRFAIDGATGEITVVDGSQLDYESATSHAVTVRVTDSGDLTHQQTLTIRVRDRNEPPTDLNLKGGTVAANAADGTLVGIVSTSDPDTGDTFGYSLTNDAGGRFAVNAATGRIVVADASLLDYGSAISHDISVRVSDSGGLTYDETFTIHVTLSTETFEVRVGATSDDAEERPSGYISLASPDLELVDDPALGGLQTTGIRFAGVQIPQGATITNAYVQFQVDETASEATLLAIAGQAGDDPADFDYTRYGISSRPTTEASVSWSPKPWTTVGQAGAAQRTPDLTSIVQEIVNRPGWSSGNSLVLIFTGTGQRVAESYNGDRDGAPLLHVEYLPGVDNLFSEPASLTGILTGA